MLSRQSALSLTVLLLATARPGLSAAKHAPGQTQQAKTAIQRAYNAGVGKLKILHWPSSWTVDPKTYQLSKKVQSVTFAGPTAHVIARQDDRVVAISPNGERHLIEDKVTFNDTWTHKGKGWTLQQSRNGGWVQTMKTVTSTAPHPKTVSL